LSDDRKAKSSNNEEQRDPKEPLLPLPEDLPLSQASNSHKQEVNPANFQRQPYGQLPFSTVKETHPKVLMGSTPLGMPQ